MTKLLPRIAPYLAVGLLSVAAFLIADKQWLHWYAADTDANTSAQSAGSGKASATAKPPTSAVLGATNPPANAGQQPTSASTPAPEPSQSALAAAQSRDGFAALWVVGQQATYKVRYDTSDADGAKGDTYVLYNRPPQGRMDTIGQGESDPASQIFVSGAGKTVACSIDAGERSCGEIKAFDAPLALAAGPMVFPAPSELGSLNVADIDSRVIAGVSARCFHVSSPQAGAEADADYCFSDSGIPLSWKGSSGSVEATELSSDLSDADFQVATE